MENNIDSQYVRCCPVSIQMFIRIPQEQMDEEKFTPGLNYLIELY